jgi:hypothetical protein
MSPDRSRDDEPDAPTPLADVLDTLVTEDDRWRVVPAHGVLTAVRGWPDGSTDTLAFLSPDTAYGRRDDANERPVWAAKGTAEQVAAAIRELNAPIPDPADRTEFEK